MAAELPNQQSHGRDPTGRLALSVLAGVWAVARLPVLALLVILEPVVRFLLAGLALLV